MQVMKATLYRLALLLLPLAFASCSGLKFQPLYSKVLTFSAADFGPEAMASPLLGPDSGGKQVIIHHSLPKRYLDQQYPGTARAYAAPAIKHLNRCVKEMPHDAAHAELRARLIRTRSIILDFYNQRRVAFTSVPPYNGRGFMSRSALMPSLGTTR
jgi:hypothetical protein